MNFREVVARLLHSCSFARLHDARGMVSRRFFAGGLSLSNYSMKLLAIFLLTISFCVTLVQHHTLQRVHFFLDFVFH